MATPYPKGTIHRMDMRATADLEPPPGSDAVDIARWTWADTDRAAAYWERSPYGREVTTAWEAAGAQPAEVRGLTDTHLLQCVMSAFFDKHTALFDYAVRRAPAMLGFYRAAEALHEDWRASNLTRSADKPDSSNDGDAAASSVPLQ